MQIWTPAFNIPHLGLTEKQNKTTTQAQNRDPVFWTFSSQSHMVFDLLAFKYVSSYFK